MKLDYLPRDAMFPFLGLNYLDPATMSDPRFSPRMSNIELDKGLVSKRRGYEVLGGLENLGSVLGLVEFETLTGTKKLCCITTTSQLVWDADEWKDVTGEAWTGDLTSELDWTVGTDDYGRWLVVTNGKNTVLKWDGVAATFTPLATGISGFETCRCVASFYGRLFLGNITVSGVQEPQSSAWSVAANWEDFSGPGSGSNLFGEASGELVRLVPLGDRLVAYFENSISVITYIGGDVLFSFEELIQQTRLLGARTVVSLGPVHAFMSEENFQLFDGTRLTRPCGEAVARGFRDEVDKSNPHLAWGFVDTPKRRAWWGVPTSPDFGFVLVLDFDLYNLSNLRWSRFDLRTFPRTMGFWSRDQTLTWEGSEGSWAINYGTWDQASSKGLFPLKVLGSEDETWVFRDEILTDDGMDVDATWESVDFVVPGSYRSELGRWLGGEFELRGLEVEILTSVDQGGTWLSAGIQTLSPAWTRYKLWWDRTSETLRVRLRSNLPFSLRWVRVWVQGER